LTNKINMIMLYKIYNMKGKGMDGETLAGRYRLERKIYSGRFLDTYVARDELLGVEVEVDVLDAANAPLPVTGERLKEILDASQRIDSLHVHRLLSWFEGEDDIHVVRERELGVSLSEILQVSGGLPREQALEVVEALVEAIAEAYGVGIYYLGLNPGRVFISPEGVPKLGRLGYGWVLEETEPAEADRVAAFRAPETDGGKEGTRASDVYSLALMVELMLPGGQITGRLRSLLDKAKDPLAGNRPSSPRLVLEAMREAEEWHARAEVGGDEESIPDDEWDRESGRRSEGAPAGRVPAERGRRLSGSWWRRAACVLCGGLLLWLSYAVLAGLLVKKGEEGAKDDGAAEPVEVVIPDLQGLSLEEARETLEGMGLACSVRRAPSRLWSEGRVMAQEPAGGSSLLPGEEVLLVVSSLAGAAEGEENGATAGEKDGCPTDAPGEPAEVESGTGAGGGGKVTSAPVPAVTPPARRPQGASPPTAVARLSSTRGPAPLCVRMDATGSFDPDGDILRYLWSCGDGTVLEGATAQHVYDPGVIPARFQVTLQVFDSRGRSDSACLVVEVY